MKRFLLWVWKRLPLTLTGKLRLLRLFTPTHLVGVVGVVWDDQDRVLLLKHTYRNEYPWGPPGGWLSSSEEPDAAVVREVTEETGLQVEVTGLVRVVREAPGHLSLVYSARFLGGTFRPSAEVSEAGFFSLMDMPPIHPEHQDLLAFARVRRVRPDA